MISAAQLAAMAATVLLSIGFPVVLLILWRRRTHAPFAAAAVGAGIFLVFALVLEQLLHALVLRPGGYVMQHAWAYVLYGALAAGVFEETGRYVGFRFLLKKHSGRETGVMYGIGHGGIEAVLVAGVTAVANLIAAVQYNSGALAAGSAYEKAGQAIAATPAALLAVSGVERVIVVCFHIALSVLVFEAVKRPGKGWLYPLAIALHAGLDVFAALYQAGVLTSIWVVELAVALFTAAVAWYAVRLYRADVPAAAAAGPEAAR